MVIATDWEEFHDGVWMEKDGHTESRSFVEERTNHKEVDLSVPDNRSGQLDKNMVSDGSASSKDIESVRKVDWERIARGMRYPRLVFDGHSVINHPKLVALGLQVEAVGVHF